MISPAGPPPSVRVLSLVVGALLVTSTGVGIVRVNRDGSTGTPAAAPRATTTTTSSSSTSTTLSSGVGSTPESGIDGTSATTAAGAAGGPPSTAATGASAPAGGGGATTTSRSSATTAPSSGVTVDTTAGIYTVDAAGTRLTRVRAGSFNLLSWSPTANRLAYGPRATVMNADGSGVTPLIPGLLVAPPSWEYNGSRLALVVQNSGHSDVVVINADGTGARGITTRGDVASVAWAPRGDIAFTAGGEVYMVRPDGIGTRQLGETGQAYRGLAWSPDGKWLAIANGAEIVISNSIGSDQRSVGLTDSHTLKWSELTWSPDSTRVVYQAGTGGASRLKIVGYDGTGLKSYAENSMSPDWSPVDENRLAIFTAGKALSNGDRDSNLELTNPNRPGYRLRVVNDKAGANESSGPQYSPDGALLAFAVGGSDSGGPAAPPSGS